MITKIHLRNWQNHANLEVELEPVTVFTGDNDKGKSAIARAVLWLAFNTWAGKAGEQITWGQTDCAVTAEVENHTICRSRGKGSNCYGIDGKILEAVGTQVPQEVQDILRLVPDNFQSQHDPPYWLSLTSSAAARELNQILNLQEIDEILAGIGGEVRQARSRVQISKERLEEARKQWQELEWTKQADQYLKKIEALQEKHAILVSQIQVLQEIQTLEEKLSMVKSLLTKLKKCGTSLSRLEQKSTKLRKQYRTLIEIQQAEEQLCQIGEKVKELRATRDALSGQLCPLCKKGKL